MVISSLLRYDSEHFESLFQTSQCYLCKTADGIPSEVLSRLSRRCEATYRMTECFCSPRYGNPTLDFGVLPIVGNKS